MNIYHTFNVYLLSSSENNVHWGETILLATYMYEKGKTLFLFFFFYAYIKIFNLMSE